MQHSERDHAEHFARGMVAALHTEDRGHFLTPLPRAPSVRESFEARSPAEAQVEPALGRRDAPRPRSVFVMSTAGQMFLPTFDLRPRARLRLTRDETWASRGPTSDVI